jgi:hypothetical protein
MLLGSVAPPSPPMDLSPHPSAFFSMLRGPSLLIWGGELQLGFLRLYICTMYILSSAVFLKNLVPTPFPWCSEILSFIKKPHCWVTWKLRLMTRSRGISALHEPSHQEKAAALDAESCRPAGSNTYSCYYRMPAGSNIYWASSAWGHGCYRDAMPTLTANLHITVYQNIRVSLFLTSNSLWHAAPMVPF